MLRNLDRLTLIALGATLAYAVFQWGGVLRTGQYEYLLVLGLLAIVLSLGRSRDAWAPQPGRPVRWAAVLLPAYVLLQVVPLPLAALRVLSPQRAAAVDALGPIGAKLSFASLSVSPARTFQHFLLVCGYVIVFLLVRELTWRCEERRWLMITPLVAVGVLEAGLGLWQYFGGTGEQARWGTYANHAHYSGFLEMVLPFAVMYPVALLRRKRSPRPAPLARWLTHRTGRTRDRTGQAAVASGSALAPSLAACGVWALAGVMFAGIIYSLSRMGFIAALFSLFVAGLLALGVRQLRWVAKSRKRQWAAAGMVAALVLAGFVFLPPDKLILRFAQIASVEGLTAEGRIRLWAETIPLIKAYPIPGCGLGGFETAFSRFKVSEPLLTDDFAHNDYLQLLAELGLAGFVIGAVLTFSVVRGAVGKAVNSADREERYFAVACAGALAAILLHSLVDFNLYIPANTMLLAWIAGMTLGNTPPPSRMSDWERYGHLTVITVKAVEVGSCR